MARAKKKQTGLQKFTALFQGRRGALVAVVLAFTIIGGYLTYASFAAKPGTTTTSPLSFPVGMTLSAKVVGPYQVDLSWTPAPGENSDTRYSLHAIGPDGTDNSQPTTLVHRQSQVGSKTNSAGSIYNSAYGVLPGQTVQYYVTSEPYLTSGTQQYRSEVITVTTPTPTSSDAVAPSVPSGVSAAMSGTMRAKVAWAPSTDDVAVSAYHIYENGWYSGSVPGDVTSYELRVIPDYYFSYHIVAVDANGNWSGGSASAGVKSPPLPLNGQREGGRRWDTEPAGRPGRFSPRKRPRRRCRRDRPAR